MTRTKQVGWRGRGVALVLAAGLLVGCDQGGQAEQALRQAAEKIRLANSGVGAPLPEAQGREIFGEVRRILAPVQEKGVAAERDAAKLILAEAQIGEASLDSRAATAALIESASRLQMAQRRVHDWQRTVDSAANVLSVSVLDGVPTLRARLDEHASALRTRQAEKAALEKQIADLEAQKAEALAQAQEERNASGELRLRADATTPIEALGLVRESQWRSRSADALEFRADAIEADIAALRPQVSEIDAHIGQLNDESQAIQMAIANLEAQDRASKQLAADLGARAEEIAAQIDELVFGSDGLIAYRKATLAPAVDKAVSGFEQAASGARGVQGSMRAQGQSTAARAMQASGTLQTQLATDQANVLGLLEAMKAIPAYEGGGASEWRQAVTELTEARATTVEAAVTALQAASDALESAGIKGDAASLEAAHARNLMAATIRTLQGEEVDHAALLAQTRRDLAARKAPPGMDVAFNDAPESSGDQGMSDRSTGDDPLRARVDEMLGMLRDGRGADIAQFVKVSNAADRAVVANILTVFDASLRIDRACQAQFGQGLSAGMMGPGMSSSASDLDAVSADSLAIEQTASTAQIRVADGAMTLPFVLDQDGQWKIDYSAFLASNPMMAPMIQQAGPMLGNVAAAIDRLADRVARGEFSSLQQVQQAMQALSMGGG